MWVLSCVKKTFTQQQWSFLGLKELFNLKDTQCYTVFSASEVMQGKSINSTAVEFPWAKSICCIGKIYNVMPSSTQVKYFLYWEDIQCYAILNASEVMRGKDIHSTAATRLSSARSLGRARGLKILFKIFARSNEAAMCQVLAATWRLKFETNVDANSYKRWERNWEVMQYMQTA